jgi:hypothetical protein
MADVDMVFEETGEVRPPRAGEWFRGLGCELRAEFAFREQSFPILRMRVLQVDNEIYPTVTLVIMARSDDEAVRLRKLVPAIESLAKANHLSITRREEERHVRSGRESNG